jgi:hypothetical protein
MFLGACVKPVGVDSLIQDERVQGLIPEKGGNLEIIWDIKPPEGSDPMFYGDGSKDYPAEIHLYGIGGSISVTIAVTNGDSFDSFEWYSVGSHLTKDRDIKEVPFIYKVEAGDFPFVKPGLYPLTVVAEKDGVPYSAYIYIRVN